MEGTAFCSRPAALQRSDGSSVTLVDQLNSIWPDLFEQGINCSVTVQGGQVVLNLALQLDIVSPNVTVSASDVAVETQTVAAASAEDGATTGADAADMRMSVSSAGRPVLASDASDVSEAGISGSTRRPGSVAPFDTSVPSAPDASAQTHASGECSVAAAAAADGTASNQGADFSRTEPAALHGAATDGLKQEESCEHPCSTYASADPDATSLLAAKTSSDLAQGDRATTEGGGTPVEPAKSAHSNPATEGAVAGHQPDGNAPAAAVGAEATAGAKATLASAAQANVASARDTTASPRPYLSRQGTAVLPERPKSQLHTVVTSSKVSGAQDVPQVCRAHMRRHVTVFVAGLRCGVDDDRLLWQPLRDLYGALHAPDMFLYISVQL